jgi:hypothetical protein
MLKALGEDPGRCGYTGEQVEKGLNALAAKSVKQLGTDATHLYHLLLKANLIDRNEYTLKLGREHPEIEKLRFDKERSQIRDLPQYIRKPIFRIFEQYSEGAVQLIDRKWHTLVLDEQVLSTPYFLKATHEKE